MRSSLFGPKHDFKTLFSRRQADYSVRQSSNKYCPEILIPPDGATREELNRSETFGSTAGNPYGGMTAHPFIHDSAATKHRNEPTTRITYGLFRTETRAIPGSGLHYCFDQTFLTG